MEVLDVRILAQLTLLASPALLALACSSGGPEGPRATPPVAKVEPTTLTEHGHERVDPYYWLNQRDNPEVIAYLEAENAYTEAETAHLADLKSELYDEMVGRVKQDDSSVPYLLDGFWYYRRYEEGRDYPIYCRRQGTLEAPEQVMLDVNAMAEGHDYYAVRGTEVTPDTRIVAYATDDVGRRIYTIRFKNLVTGEIYPDAIEDATGNLTWALDNTTLFYSRQDEQTLRSHQVWRHELGTDPAEDVLVYEEADEEFNVFVYRTKSKRFLMIGSFQTLSSETRVLEADNPAGEFRIVLRREPDHEYTVDHFGDDFYIRTNWQAKNFRLMKTPVKATGKANWKEVEPHHEDALFEGFEVFRDRLVLVDRVDGLTRMRIRRWDGGDEHTIDFGEAAYNAYVDTNPEIDSSVLRYGYTSMTTPNSIYDYDMKTRKRTLMKRDEVLGGFSPDDYASERIWVTARDGARVPVSIVYRLPFERDGSRPTLLYGYGSYGITIDPGFSSDRLSLLDRGFVYAIAHIRGSETLGRAWYEDGKLLKKMNTFTDFIDAGDALVAQRYADPGRLYASGGSAGGLLMGAVANMRPDLFRGIVARVPFVDVVTTMLDESIPLTTGEYDEWGDPREKEYYDYMLSYSPYDQVEAKDYPAMLVMTGLHDSQVQYWEPAKWVARLRAMKTDTNPLLLYTNMDAGHGGASGRFRSKEETALIFAFLLDLAGEAGS